jgi:hypothetical protein
MTNKLVGLTWVIAALLLPSLPAGAKTTPDVGDVVVSQAVGSPAVRFTILTSNGYVGFTVSKDWRVLEIQSKPPVAVSAFQVFNRADQGTSDSTNIVVSLIQPETDKGKDALSKVGKSYEGEVQSSSRSGWDCFSQTAHQHGMPYTILDAKKRVADVIVSVRVAWPHLKKNSATYDGDLSKVFESLLDSVDGNLGPYSAKPGDVVRRPDQ